MSSHIISFMLAAALSVQLILVPALAISNGLFLFFVFGVLVGFYHGIGFEPANTFRRIIFGPTVAWPIMMFGLYSIFSKMGFV